MRKCWYGKLHVLVQPSLQFCSHRQFTLNLPTARYQKRKKKLSNNRSFQSAYALGTQRRLQSYFWTEDQFGETSTHTDCEAEAVRECVCRCWRGEHHTHRSSSLCGSVGASATELTQLYSITTLCSTCCAYLYKLYIVVFGRKEMSAICLGHCIFRCMLLFKESHETKGESLTPQSKSF